MSATIVLVEDDAEIARLLELLLEAEGYTVQHYRTAEEGLRQCEAQVPELAILDVMLPGQDGLWCCRQLRQRGYAGSVLMLTASEGDVTEVVALNGGADDYLRKPVKTHLLLARVRALLRRQSRGQTGLVRLAGGFELDTGARTLHWGEQRVPLTEAEYELLALLASADGPISREACFMQLRGLNYNGTDRAIDMRVSTLRKKLDAFAPGQQVVRTLRARGYLLVKAP